MSNQVEILPAEKYYHNMEKVGAPAVGWVVLVNGQPHHETDGGMKGKKAAEEFAKKFGWVNESDWKPVGSGEPNDPIIGHPSMKGRRWQIDWAGSGKSFPKITQSEKPTKSLKYKDFYRECFLENKTGQFKPTAYDYEEIKKWGFDKYGVGWKRDKNGIYCKTHRCRSKSYPEVKDIPIEDVKFIDSTG
jgi:hypothetical protein